LQPLLVVVLESRDGGFEPEVGGTDRDSCGVGDVPVAWSRAMRAHSAARTWHSLLKFWRARARSTPGGRRALDPRDFGSGVELDSGDSLTVRRGYRAIRPPRESGKGSSVYSQEAGGDDDEGDACATIFGYISGAHGVNRFS
jgi:hypothetical protein